MAAQYDSRTAVIAVMTGILLTGIAAWLTFGKDTATVGYVDRQIASQMGSLDKLVLFQEKQIDINARLAVVVETLTENDREHRDRLRNMERRLGSTGAVQQRLRELESPGGDG